MPENHERRRQALRDLLAETAPDASALLVTGLVNVRYLTGFTGSNGVLLLTRDDALFGTDGRYTTQAAAECPDLPTYVDRDTATAVTAEAARRGISTLAVESEHVSLAGYEDLVSAAGDAAILAPCRGLVETLRRTKDDEEIELLRQACRISDEALADLLIEIRPGLTEQQVARRLESLMLDHGADAPSFETIVATGPNSAIPHHSPTPREIVAGDLLKIDFGALYRGYHADETRTFVVGREAADWQREVHALVATAQQAGREALHPDADARETDELVRAIIRDAGHAEHYDHGLGHGVGLEIHEAPLMGPRSRAGTIGARTPVTVEPGVYLPGRGGVRIEDTLLVTADGAESLTTTTRELLVLG